MGSPIKQAGWPAWALTVGAMQNNGTKVRALCTECDGTRDVDLSRVEKRRGADYSLINRRTRCRITVGCTGWNRFYLLWGVYRPLWDHATDDRWTLADRRAR